MNNIKRIATAGTLLLASFTFAANVAGQAVAAPAIAGYGYVLSDGPVCTVWWAEGAYKVMKDDPVPVPPRAAAGAAGPAQGGGAGVRISCARNEYEPFLLVLKPKVALGDIRVHISDLTGPGGAVLPAASLSVRHVEYVRVDVPTDAAGRAGWWPDPLPPYDGPFAAAARENHPLWITVGVPADAKPGSYLGAIALSAGTWSELVRLDIKVRDFALPAAPTVRSSFGLSTDDIRRYHNLETREELEFVTDLYYKDMKEHRVAPTSPFDLYPIRVAFGGVFWEGGEFVKAPVHGGARALKVTDADAAHAVDARAASPVAVDAGSAYELSLWAKTDKPDQEYTVLLEAADAEGRLLYERNVLRVFKGTGDWKKETVDIKGFGPGAATVRLRLFPAFRSADGTAVGTAWFDDIVLARMDVRPQPQGGAAPSGTAAAAANLIPGGDFEMPLEGMSVAADFRAFDPAAKRYLDEFGFNAFNLPIQGLGSGSFYDRTAGVFGGFVQGTPEYDRLLSEYLGQVEAHLAANGWLGKEYIYWFDEPDPKDYPFVREGMFNIRKNAPRLTRFITEHRPGPEIMDVSEIGCTIFDRVDPKVIAALAPKGREFWSYLCTGPKSPWVTLFIDHPAVNLRMWLWMSYACGLKGVLVWRANYWNSATLFPADVLQNPWADPMSYTVGYGVPFGQPNTWGNGDGRFLYPPNRDPGRDKTKYAGGPVDSVRWEILREGLEDYEYFVLLEKAAAAAPPARAALAAEARALLKFPAALFAGGKDYTKDPKALLDYRAKVADMIERLGKK